MKMNNARPVKVLLVEDSLHDIEITRRAFAKGGVRSEIYVARDGQEALDYLYHLGKYQLPETSPRPGIILLDLNLPKIDGLEVLRQIKQDEGLKAIPVIVLTVSQRQEDISLSYNYGVNAYIQKPVEFQDFVKVINTIQECWALVATLPPDPA
ncbi:MAG: response regulator [Nitrospiria bacterium]